MTDIWSPPPSGGFAIGSTQLLVDYLFRAILFRIPSPEEIQSHVDSVAGIDVATAGAVLAQRFSSSDEGQALSRRSHRLGHDTLVDETEKPPATIISLGGHCATSYMLKDSGLKQWSGPFDWIFSSPEMVAHCVSDGFQKFLDPSFYEPNMDPVATQHGFHICNHAFYRDVYGINYVFNHDNPADPQKHDYYTRCVARFVGACNSPSRKLFVAAGYGDVVRPDNFVELLEALSANVENFDLLAIRVLDGVKPWPESFGLSKVMTLGRSHFVDFQPTSRLGPLYFEAAIDNQVFCDVIRKFDREANG